MEAGSSKIGNYCIMPSWSVIGFLDNPVKVSGFFICFDEREPLFLLKA